MKEIHLKIDDEVVEKVKKMIYCRHLTGNAIGADIELAHLIVKAVDENNPAIIIGAR